jgi:hypothetical protein
MFAFYADCHPIKYGLVSSTDQVCVPHNLLVAIA